MKIINNIEFGIVDDKTIKHKNLLALDQARNCGFSIFNTETKELMSYGCYSYPNTRFTFAHAVMNIERRVIELIEKNDIGYAAIEGIQLRQNPRSYASLAQLQGVLINLFEKNKIPYTIIQPSSWQSFCNARGRTSKEVKEKVKALLENDISSKKESSEVVKETNVKAPKKKSKVLSIQYVKNKYSIETENDNIADAICIGTYVVDNINKFYSEDFT